MSNIFITLLATAHFLVGLIISPMHIAIVILRANFSNHVLFQMENFLWIQSLAATTFNLGADSVDRYFAVTSALRYHSTVNTKRSVVTILILWSASCILASLIFFMENYYQAKTLFLTSQVFRILLNYYSACTRQCLPLGMWRELVKTITLSLFYKKLFYQSVEAETCRQI